MFVHTQASARVHTHTHALARAPTHADTDTQSSFYNIDLVPISGLDYTRNLKWHKIQFHNFENGIWRVIYAIIIVVVIIIIVDVITDWLAPLDR